MDKIKETVKKNLRRVFEEQTEAHWYDTSDVKTQEKTFVWDAKEYLTSHFGTVGFDNENKIMSNLLKIFREAQKDIHQHGPNPDYRYVEGIIRALGYKRYKNEDSDLEYPEDVYNDIVGVITLIYNGE